MTKWLVLSIALAACGDNRIPVDAPPHEPDAAAPPPRAVVVSGNFMPGQPGVMSVLDLATMHVDTNVATGGSVGDDPVLRKFGNELFVVNRADGNNVTILDATSYEVREQLGTGAGSNPQDVAVVGSKLYVPGFGTSGVIVLTRGSTTKTMIDLSTLDPDGKPDCISAFLVGTDVYVACELLDGSFSPRGPGKVVVIDTATDTVTHTITMANKNPFGLFEQSLATSPLGGDLVIPTSPAFGDPSMGCLERISTGASPAANGCVITNQVAGGYQARVAFFDVLMFLIASSYDTEAHGSLEGYDLMTTSLWTPPISPSSQLLIDVVMCPDGTLVVADQKMGSAGLRIYVNALETSPGPLDIGLKPGSNHGLACY